MNGYLLPLLGGMGAGIVMSFMLGTVFFALINNSINSGPFSGALVATGVLISDILFIGIVLFGSQYIPELMSYENEVKWLGGSFIVLLGMIQIIRQSRVHYQDLIYSVRKKAPLLFISEGFMLNVLNPVNLVMWGGITAYLTNVYHLNLIQKIYFFSGAITAIFFTETGISYLAHRLKKLLNAQRIKHLNYFIGGLFILLGILMITK